METIVSDFGPGRFFFFYNTIFEPAARWARFVEARCFLAVRHVDISFWPVGQAFVSPKATYFFASPKKYAKKAIQEKPIGFS